MTRPFDYSKWDDIDTDSEPEAPPPSIPTPAPAPRAPEPTTTPQSPRAPSPATAAAPTTNGGPDGSTKAVIVRCNGERSRAAPWSAVTINSDHPVFFQRVAPVPELLGIPLVVHRVGTRSAHQADLDNQIITYLHIDAEEGLAPPQWQSHIGTAVVAREDGKPLLPQHLEGVWMYCDYILDLFGNGEGAPTHLYNRLAFEEWWKGYCEEQRAFRRGTGGEKDPDDWRAVRSPYEM
ncbi:hypothetical protein SLS62_000420 [Diatrype stigma]|uniref:Ectomycorrhiza-upregulated zf-mynd domain-containing protein n=1 Tax=Diatrype stigma TaxID=117547 RepID=A0AAN9UZT3_9PEZI